MNKASFSRLASGTTFLFLFLFWHPANAAPSPAADITPPSAVCAPKGDGENEITDRVFIGGEYVGNDCLIANRFVPLAPTFPNQARLFSVRQPNEAETIRVELDEDNDSIWLGSCFIGNDEADLFSAYYKDKLGYIRDRQMLYSRCTNRAQPGSLSRYNFNIKLSRLPARNERVTLARWRSIPDIYRHQAEGKTFTGVRFDLGYSYETLAARQARFESDDFDALTLEVRDGFLALVARADKRELTLGQGCDFDGITRIKSGATKSCGKSQSVTLIRKIPVNEAFPALNSWTSMIFSVAWSKYEGGYKIPGAVAWTIDNRTTGPRWFGDIGRSDDVGPYFSFGGELQRSQPARASGKSAPQTPETISIFFERIGSARVQPGYNVNLIRNPNNYGVYSKSWTHDGSRYARPFLHNRVQWGYGGAVTGFFAAPYYWAKRSQTIDLRQFIKNNKITKVPDILIGEQFNLTYCGGDQIQFSVRLLDENKKLIRGWATKVKQIGKRKDCAWRDLPWKMISHTFKGLEKMPSYIEFIDGGKDSEYWAGYYGPRMKEATVILLDKTQTISE